MKIKTKILISFLLVAALTILLFSVSFFIIFYYGLNDQFLFAKRSIDNFSTAYLEIEEGLKGDIIKSFVKPITENLAGELDSLIKEGKIETSESEIKKYVDKKLTFDGITYKHVGIINENGIIIFALNNEFIGKNYEELKTYYPNLYPFIKTALTKQKHYDFIEFYKNNQVLSTKEIFHSVHLTSRPWVFFTCYSTSSAVKSTIDKANRLNKEELLKLKKKADDFFDYQIAVVGVVIIILFVFIILLNFWISVKVAGRVTRPIVDLKNSVEKLGKGNFNVKVKDSEILEIKQLTSAFNRLGTDLSIYMERLKKEVAERNFIENEIKIAQSIQESVLPELSKEFDNTSFSLYSKLIPAKDVAGDFFDFFFLDHQKTKLAFLLADVSGKGFSAAFFMGIVKATIKSACLSDKDYNPGNVLTKVNEMISDGNSELMFVTVFLAFYDLETGNLRYANAGHHQTVKIPVNNKIEKFGDLNNQILGITPGYEYSSGLAHVDVGEKLILYTDGVTEAVSPKGNFYEEERLDKLLSDNPALSPEAVCNLIVDNVSRFQKNKLFDDITVLAFVRNS